MHPTPGLAARRKDRCPQLERAWGEYEARASALAGELNQKRARDRTLVDERERLWRREPGLFKSDSERSPLEDDNAVAQIDQQRRDLGDLDALTAQANHAQQVATRARQDYEQYVREHRKEILEELRPTSEQKAAAYNAAIDTAVNEGQAYIDLCKRLMNVAAIAGPNTRIPALDHASTLMRDLRDRPLPPPELMG